MTSALLHSSPQHYYITLSLPDIIRTTLIYFLLLRDDSQVFTIIPTCLFHHHYLSQGDPSRCFTTSYYYAIMHSAPHAMVDNLNHKQYFSQVPTAPHCRNAFPYSSPLLAIAAPWVRIALY